MPLSCSCGRQVLYGAVSDALPAEKKSEPSPSHGPTVSSLQIPLWESAVEQPSPSSHRYSAKALPYLYASYRGGAQSWAWLHQAACGF